uniref:Uncharacterized protein n=1 Tax=Rhabditophanes sp. KR3021 TaxID=114890 RepID=A0AC35U4X4_9BILA
MSQLFGFNLYFLMLMTLPVCVVAFDWGDWHKISVCLFTLLGFSLLFSCCVAIVYFGALKRCLQVHQEDVLHTHRAFHPWPPGSAQWDKQQTYRAWSERNKGENYQEFQNHDPNYDVQQIGQAYSTQPQQFDLAKQNYVPEHYNQSKPLYSTPQNYTTSHQLGVNTSYGQQAQSYIKHQTQPLNCQTLAAHEPNFPPYYRDQQLHQLKPNLMSPSDRKHVFSPTKMVTSFSPQLTENYVTNIEPTIRALSPHYTSIKRESSQLTKTQKHGESKERIVNEIEENIIYGASNVHQQQYLIRDFKTHTYI